MRLFEIMDIFKVYDICKDSFTVELIGSDVLSFICIQYKNEWIVVNMNTEKIDCHCISRCDCLECLYYFHGLPF